jgi:hypothetical protein
MYTHLISGYDTYTLCGSLLVDLPHDPANFNQRLWISINNMYGDYTYKICPKCLQSLICKSKIHIKQSKTGY